MRCSAVSVLDPLPSACCRLRCGALLNERKKGRTVRPLMFAPAVARSVVSGEVCGYAAFLSGYQGAVFAF
ncbi:hypothetical protein DM756_21055 [Salmonella enterica subsp. enterica serovar Javiana]|nr:hypothetical protein [Salmonella enterica subsp. enterica serovar Javiana]ECS8567324.1 hypothetical protein [Salmonella enterica subsp. enterica serovar Javiana]